MIPKKDILKVVKTALRKKRGTPDTRIMHPLRDWTAGLLVTALMFIASALYASYTFLDLLRSADEQVFVESSIVPYKQKEALGVFELYRNRIREFELLRAERVVVEEAAVESKEMDSVEVPTEENPTAGI